MEEEESSEESREESREECFQYRVKPLQESIHTIGEVRKSQSFNNKLGVGRVNHWLLCRIYNY